jgi:hypothetical protein
MTLTQLFATLEAHFDDSEIELAAKMIAAEGRGFEPDSIAALITAMGSPRDAAERKLQNKILRNVFCVTAPRMH